MRWRVAMMVGSGLVTAAVACSSFTGNDTAPETADGGDAAPNATPDGGPFCAGFPDAGFCFSFDDGTDPRIGGELTLVEPSDASVTATAVSPPNALAVEVSSSKSDLVGDPRTGVIFEIRDAGTHVHCDLQLWAEQVSTTIDASTTSLDVMLIGMAGVGPLAAFDYSLTVPDPGALTYNARVGTGTNHVNVGNLTPAKWTPIGVDIVLANGAATVRGSLQDQTLGSPVSISTTGTGLGDVQVGMGEAFVVGDWVVRLDNVVCNWE